MPLVLALVVFIAFNVEGIRAQGPIGYVKSLIPAGVHGPMLLLIGPLEIISTFMRLISLTIRLFANILAGHMIILFMSGGLAVILGAARSWAGSRCRSASPSTCSSWAWWPPCRRSSSRPSPPSTSVAP